MNELQTPKWATSLYSRKQIERASKEIRDTDASIQLSTETLSIVDNWRASHAYPLHVIYMNFRRYAKKDNSIIVAERLKRLDSIVNKLRRFPTMNLWRMQDLGGCRIITQTNEDVYRIAQKYQNSRIRHTLKSEYDYIEHPKTSGYRSLHRVYQYHTENLESPYSKNFLIEIQFRTSLQHMWATALETMGIFTNQALKSGQGDKEIHRFFALISSLFAIEEGKPLVPGTPITVDELIHEIESINAKNNYLDLLSAIKVAVGDRDGKGFDKQGFYLLILNYKTRLLKIKYFQPSKVDEANKIYKQIEATRKTENIDAVLVRVESFRQLKNAYPNYFSDIDAFIEKVKAYLKY